jgi:hypothetical protein
MNLQQNNNSRLCPAVLLSAVDSIQALNVHYTPFTVEPHRSISVFTLWVLHKKTIAGSSASSCINKCFDPPPASAANTPRHPQHRRATHTRAHAPLKILFRFPPPGRVLGPRRRRRERKPCGCFGSKSPPVQLHLFIVFCFNAHVSSLVFFFCVRHRLYDVRFPSPSPPPTLPAPVGCGTAHSGP